MMEETIRSVPNWYVVRTNLKQEDRAENNLKAWGIETFAPKIKDHRIHPFTDERIPVIKYLFPRYLFARFEPDHLLGKVKFTRGVQSVVSFSGKPAQVDDEVIDLIQSRLGDDELVQLDDQEPGQELKQGSEVVITDGPLKSMRGVFESRLRDSDRVTILLNTVGYQASVVVDRKMIMSA